MPRQGSVRCPHWLLTTPFAHRGLHADERKIPENSLAAFDAAVSAGYGIELDVRLTADNVAVVFHDAELRRMTGCTAKVRDLQASALAPLRLHGTGEPIPLLRDVLAHVQGRVPLLIEIKSGTAAGFAETAVLDAVRAYNGPVAMQSFDPRIVYRLRRAATEFPCGLLSGSLAGERDISVAQRLALENLLYTPIVKPDFVAYEYAALTPWRRILIQHILRKPLLVWTIRNPAAAAAAARLGANIIFEGFLTG